MERLGEAVGVCKAPGEGGEGEEEGEQIGKGRVRAVVCLCGLFLGCWLVVGADSEAWRGASAYMVEDLAKHLLGRNDEAHDLPDGHLKVHLGELEHALEEARHLDFAAPRRGRRAKVGGPARRPWEGDVWVHGGRVGGGDGGQGKGGIGLVVVECHGESHVSIVAGRM